MLRSSPITSSLPINTPGSTSSLDSLVIPSPSQSSSATLLGGVTSIKVTTATPPISTSTIQPATVPTLPTISSSAVGVIAPSGGASNSSFSTSRPVIPTSNPIQPAKATQAQSTSLQLPTSESKTLMTVTEPVIVYVTKGAPSPFSTSVIHHAPSVNNSSVSSANPTVEPSDELTTTSLNFVTIHSTATSVVRVTVYPTSSSSPASSSSILPSSTGSTVSVDGSPIETSHASATLVVPMTTNSATPSLLSSLLLPSPDEIPPGVTAHVTSTSVYPSTSLPSSVSSLLPPSSQSASIVTVRVTSTSVIPLTVYSTTLPSAPSSLSETAPLETAPVVTAHVTSTSVVPVTVYSATSLPYTVPSLLPSFSETTSRETAPVATTHVTSTKSVHLTLDGSTSTGAAETIHAADPTSAMDANIPTTTSQPGQGILTVNPVTPSGFITITETQTETKTVTDRITETVTATVTRN
ncbi:hypothetical protein LT330_002134 [Penicillium expansum]|nr:hypothetical protein LT330_002134 [Penicillium expansum]